MPRFVKVAIDSALPQLDKLFDYLVPEGVEVAPGVRLLVPFGRAKKATAGFAVELSETTDAPVDKVAEILEVVSQAQVLKPEIYELCRAIADRQVATLNDVLKLAVPSRSVKVEANWLLSEHKATEVVEFDFEGGIDLVGKRLAFEPINHFVGKHPGWALQFVKTALANLRKAQSTIIIVPDHRDQQAIVAILQEIEATEVLAHFQNSVTPSVRYEAFLKTLASPCIVLGSRSAVFAPVTALASILMLNDSDSSLFEPTSPYLATREIALMRQQQQDCQLVLAAHARSCEVQRLVELKYLTEVKKASKPKLAVTESEARVDSLAFQIVRKALEAGGSVLIQVSSAGTTNSLFCQKCSERMHCKFCEGPVGLDANQKPKCKWCAGFNLDLTCSNCGGVQFRQGRAGETRTVAEFGRSFSGVNVVEASAEKRVVRLKPGKRIVVSTVGAEPIVDGGYDAVVLLDAQNLLSYDTLKASENAVRHWADAVSLLKAGGQGVLVGVAGKLGQQFALWNLNQIAEQELAERRELGFPPHFRMGSLSGSADLARRVVESLPSKFKPGQIEVLGPMFDANEARYLLRYEYSVGSYLASELRARLLSISAGETKVNPKTGRTSRALKLKMDDSEVI
ncbi:MAG: hypothetical protein ACKOWE_06520 [Micrococcales bacterium]